MPSEGAGSAGAGGMTIASGQPTAWTVKSTPRMACASTSGSSWAKNNRAPRRDCLEAGAVEARGGVSLGGRGTVGGEAGSRGGSGETCSCCPSVAGGSGEKATATAETEALDELRVRLLLSSVPGEPRAMSTASASSAAFRAFLMVCPTLSSSVAFSLVRISPASRVSTCKSGGGLLHCFDCCCASTTAPSQSQSTAGGGRPTELRRVGVSPLPAHVPLSPSRARLRARRLLATATGVLLATVAGVLLGSAWRRAESAVPSAPTASCSKVLW
uniref:Uncharacterized protein n=1 Tax=Alexandrium monilatum TaxID=311494 RepID=A0A7S4Q424_9DINO